MSSPFFVLGFPRSGTSALRLHLTCHPDLIVPPECSFLTWLYPRYAGWSTADLDTARLDEFVVDVQRSRKFSTWKLDVEQVRSQIVEASPGTYAELAGCVYRAYARQQGKAGARWGDKNNVHLTMVATLANLYPDAQYVVIVRDVRDVLASVRDVNQLSKDLEFRPELPSDAVELAHLWRDQNAAALATLGTVGAGRRMVLRYEDLVSDPRAVLGQVAEFLHVGWSDQMLAAPEVNRRSGLEPVETMAWKELTLRSLTAERVGRWSTSVSAADAVAAVAESEPAFSSLGYRRAPSDSR
jgi:hypothetical protein